ncbi:bifunctional DNA-binding transcriptional regulator/O6-methylguanine-DNA methyltransferase Ada [Luteimonas sp. R10]|uniref:bifunctional DNA-binding transcriptional regulator/O6-methylguanine-DNA methyltransferase Ada n=1 Tax=Luteimonas sp. R10 TaxID=3108176 RepID=UPI00308AA949|nr:bifunctional DNA-binding transcriptional regulator/O6-methylguanine-DNA methyltransferase Ada [Luteimonas sp. R10]
MSLERSDLRRGGSADTINSSGAFGDGHSAATNGHEPAPEPIFQTDEQRWDAVLARDRTADDHFVYAVRTTGVYSRPSSSARLPMRANVEFFDTALAAEAAGYRASRRAASDRTASAAQRANLVTRACRLIEASERPPTLARLGAWAGMSPFHFQRVFKAEVGVSPKAYALAARARKLRLQLRNTAASTTDAIFGAGFNSSGHFYATVDRRLGMSAGAFRNGGAGTSIHFATGVCSLGPLLVAQSDFGICAILLGDDPDTLLENLRAQFPKAILMRGDRAYESLVQQVIEFVDAPVAGLNLPLDVRGTAFQERVWKVFLDIPAGTTVTYAEIARRIGRPGAARAVAQAGAANPLALVIPCHRVIRGDGDISGCRWGVDRTRRMLQREASAAAGK